MNDDERTVRLAALAAELVRWKGCTLTVAGVELHRIDEATANKIRESLETTLHAFGSDCHFRGMQRAAKIARDHAIACATACETVNKPDPGGCGTDRVLLPYGKMCGARDVEGLIRKDMDV